MQHLSQSNLAQYLSHFPSRKGVIISKKRHCVKKFLDNDEQAKKAEQKDVERTEKLRNVDL